MAKIEILYFNSDSDYSANHNYLEDPAQADGVKLAVVANQVRQNVALLRLLGYLTARGATVLVISPPIDTATVVLDGLGLTTSSPILATNWQQSTLWECPNPELKALIERFRPDACAANLPGSPLCWIKFTDVDRAVAADIPCGKGRIVVIPCGSLSQVAIGALVNFVQSLSSPEVPDYGAAAHLPGETKIVGRLAEIAIERHKLEAELAQIAAWRALIGEATGSVFVEIAVRALRYCLEETGWAPDEDHLDLGNEDFALRHSDDRRVIAGEAKGQSGGIARSDVLKAGLHRVVLSEKEPDKTVNGLLVVNQFRRGSLEERRIDPAPNVQAHARRDEVLVLRAWDLFRLVGVRLSGAPFPVHEFETALAVGGSLSVDKDNRIIVTPAMT